MGTRYSHTNIVAEDWRRLARFYVEVFGCVEVPPLRRQRGDWLSRGTGVEDAALEGMHLLLPGYGEDGPTLEIYQYAQIEPTGATAANRKGLGHLAFQVDDVEACRRQILAHGGSTLGEITEVEVEGVGPLTFVYMADPEGNVLEIQRWR